MTDSPTVALELSLQVPQTVYDYLQQTAAQRHISFEEAISEELLLLADYSLPSHTELEGYTDEQLKAVLDKPFNPLYRQRLDKLLELGNQGERSPAEAAEADYLVELADEYVILRSKALVLLQERGYDIQPYLEHKT